MKLKEAQLFDLVIKLTKPFAVPKACARDGKLKEVLVSYLFVLIIKLKISRIFSEALVSVSNRHNYKTSTKGPPASLLHCIENILNHSSGKCHDSLSMAALSLTKSTGISTIFIH